MIARPGAIHVTGVPLVRNSQEILPMRGLLRAKAKRALWGGSLVDLKKLIIVFWRRGSGTLNLWLI